MRAIAVAIGTVLLSLAWAGTASALESPHGGYSSTTDGCAGCHRTHTAPAPKLLVSTNTALCLTCHGTAAAGADVNVADGVYEGTTAGTQNAGLNGGGFTNAKQNTNLLAVVSGAVTSRHGVQGTADYSATAAMWGAGANGSGAGSAFDLYCTSCHDPHGSTNYRDLKTTVNGVAVTLARTDDAAKSYTSPRYYAGSSSWQVSSFCSACHTRYGATASASGETASGDAIFAYRHRTDAPSGASLNSVTYTFPAAMNLPVSTTSGAAPATSPDNRLMVCLTCHYAHGSRAAMGTNAGGLTWPGGATTPSGNARSSLLRLDNSGVCQNCHDK